MNPECSIPVLESALAGKLSERDEESLHHHLEHCEACSAALEQLAGGLALRKEAAELLRDDDLDRMEAEAGEPSDIDFTVEHLEPSDEPNVLGRLGGYDILEVIGRGGMGVVLKGYDRELKRCVALKVLAPHLANSSLARKRFAREAQAAAAIVHPNVLAIHQVQPVGPLPFLVMPLVAGETLAQRLTREGTLELKECLRIGMQTAAALSAAHEQGLVHRDVKPANILVERGIERAMLMDFGLARANDDVTMTRWGVIAGTPQYMSPEQARGEPLDGRSDLFGLGCVLYEMASGVSPFRADSVMATLRRLVEDSPQAMASLAPELPPWFVAIIERLLDKDPARRFATAKEVAELLESCLGHVQQPTVVPLPKSLASKSSRSKRSPRVFGVMTMIAALAACVVAALVAFSDPAPDISGRWSGPEWGTVILKEIDGGIYGGTYSDTVSKQPGEIRVTWSRVERRFNGTWREGNDRFGELSIRLVDGEIRGALTTDARSKINPATPRLADLFWVRAMIGSNSAGWPAPVRGPAVPDKAPSTPDRAPPARIDGKTAPTKIVTPSEKFSVDFRAGKPLPAELAPRTPLAASRTNIAPGGLRIDMPADRKDLGPVALDTAFGIRGDFDIVATYEILKADAPVAGDGIGVLIGIQSAPIRREAWVGWMLRGVDKEVAQWHRGEAKAGEVMNIEGGEEKWASRLGRLRLQRRGKLLEYSIAPGVAGDDFQRLSRWVYGDSDIQFASLIAGTNGQAKALDARWLDLSVTADKLLHREAPKPPGRPVR
jgi:serine/threonine-protein kinase